VDHAQDPAHVLDDRYVIRAVGSHGRFRLSSTHPSPLSQRWRSTRYGRSIANFSNYAPVINHLLELLDDPEADALMRHFPKLKSKDTHLDQEVLWEKACNRVQWQ